MVAEGVSSLKCPACGSHSTKKVSVLSASWRIGAHRCTECGHEAHWTHFTVGLPEGLKITLPERVR